jgi:hypothetical protein
MDDELDIPSLRVVDLKLELEKRGLSKSGTKRELADRLQAYINSLKDLGSVISDGDVSMVSLAEDPEDAPLKPAKHQSKRQDHEEMENQEKSEDKLKKPSEHETSPKKGSEEKKKEVSEETDDFDDAIVMSTSEMFEDDFLAESDKRSPRKSEKSLAAVNRVQSPQKVVERVSPVKVSPVKPLKESPPKPAKSFEVVHDVPKEHATAPTTTAQAAEKAEKSSDSSQPSKSVTQDDPTIIPFRRLARSQSNQQRSQKASWSSINKDKNSSSVVVTSQELTDIVPDIKPILESLNETKEVKETMFAVKYYLYLELDNFMLFIS